MLLAGPPRTQADLNFRLFGIPVRVHPLFWLVSLFMGSSLREAKLVLMWVAASFIAILVHEFGHAFAALAFGWRPWITLYGMGGLASYRPTHHDSRKQIMISFAGPGAGFVLAALIVLLFKVLDGVVVFGVGWPFLVRLAVASQHLPVMVNLLANFVLFICVFWGLVNLLPILPLDGGRICQELLLMYSRGNSTAQALGISIVTAVAVAVYGGVVVQDYFLAMFFGFMAFQNYQAFQMMGGGGGGYGRW